MRRYARWQAIGFVPLITGLLPIVAIHVSLVLAIEAGTVPSCIPYLDGCMSISATGRNAPASFVFKPAMMSEWVIMAGFWLANAVWLGALARISGETGTAGRLAAVFGVAGAFALVLYVTFLGTQEPFYQFMRRFGVYLYFLFTIIAQIISARAEIRAGDMASLPHVARIGRIQLWLCALPFALGALNLVLKVVLVDADAAENRIEWLSALLMHGWFVLSFLAWRVTKFGISGQVTVDSAAGGRWPAGAQPADLDVPVASDSSSSPSGANE